MLSSPLLCSRFKFQEMTNLVIADTGCGARRESVEVGRKHALGCILSLNSLLLHTHTHTVFSQAPASLIGITG